MVNYITNIKKILIPTKKRSQQVQARKTVRLHPNFTSFTFMILKLGKFGRQKVLLWLPLVFTGFWAKKNLPNWVGFFVR